jgi:hypothetical protein
MILPSVCHNHAPTHTFKNYGRMPTVVLVNWRAHGHHDHNIPTKPRTKNVLY